MDKLLKYTDEDTQYYNVSGLVSKLYKKNCTALITPNDNMFFSTPVHLLVDSKIYGFHRMMRGLKYPDSMKIPFKTLKNILESNISPKCFKPLDRPITLYRGVDLLDGVESLETPSKSYLSTVSIENIDNIHIKNTILVIRVQPGVFLFNLKDIGEEWEQGEIVLDKGGTFYVNDYVKDGLTINGENIDIIKVTYFPKQHCATLYPQLSYETLLNSTCNVLPGLFMEGIKSADATKLEQNYITDITRCEGLNNTILTRDPETSLRVLTYNVHEWKNRTEQNTKEECVRAILDINPDIVCLQEVTEQLPDTLLAAYPSTFVIKSEPYADYNLYMSVLSKYPIKYSEKFSLSPSDPILIKESRDCIHCIVDYRGKDTHVYNIHLSLKIHVARKQINDIVNIINNDLTDNINKPLNTPFVIAGDFNHIDSINYTRYELGFLKKNSIDDIPLNLYKSIRKITQIDRNPENFNKIRYTVWSSRAVDFIFPNLEMFNYVYSGFCYTTASDHLPYFMDLSFVDSDKGLN